MVRFYFIVREISRKNTVFIICVKPAPKRQSGNLVFGRLDKENAKGKNRTLILE
ncbi:conserved hypothetical protein [delta proteobacterium NaphS2]|nr:conserved hypothetical protein [delta proteobacterium NaphS2]